MGSQTWTRWVAIGVVVVVALGGSVIGALSLGGHDGTRRVEPAAPEAVTGATIVLPRQPLGWNPVLGPDTEVARREAEEFGKGFGAQTVYAEYAHGDASLAFTGIVPSRDTDLGRALAESPDAAISHQFVNVGLGEGTPYRSGVAGVSLRCGEPKPGRQACIWADRSALALMSWTLPDGDVARAAQLSAGLIPSFRQPS